MIEARRLSKWYGPVIGLNDISFTLEPGVTGFLGPNGAGKSTLLKLLTGMLKPSKGDLLLNGQVVWNNYELLKEIGYCPETDAFWQYLTGREFIRVLLQLSGYSAGDVEVYTERALQTVHMTEHAEKRIGGYSKGMRQRIKLAQAIAHTPQIIFLDEPLNGMDPIGRKQTIELIKTWGLEGRTVVVSSHILHEVEEMTDRILLINHGRQIAFGNIYEIRELIETHPLKVTIRSKQVRHLAAKLMDAEDVLGMEFDRDKNQITVETNKPKIFHERLTTLVLKDKIQIEALWSPDEDLEAVYDYLVK